MNSPGCALLQNAILILFSHAEYNSICMDVDANTTDGFCMQNLTIEYIRFTNKHLNAKRILHTQGHTQHTAHNMHDNTYPFRLFHVEIIPSIQRRHVCILPM